jgi:hypothetical protein
MTCFDFPCLNYFGLDPLVEAVQRSSEKEERKRATNLLSPGVRDLRSVNVLAQGCLVAAFRKNGIQAQKGAAVKRE